MLEYLAAALAGVLCAVFPGLHPNTAAAVIQSLPMDPRAGALSISIIVGLYSALCFFGAIFLGLPSGDTVVSLLPGQRLHRAGRGREAAAIVAISAVLGMAAAVVLGALALGALAGLAAIVSPWLVFILPGACAFMVWRERDRLAGAEIFILAALCGVLSTHYLTGQPLFSLFAGFFAVPAILMHLRGEGSAAGREADPAVAAGRAREPEDHSLSFLPYALAGALMGGLADFLPGISSPSQLAAFSAVLLDLRDPRDFLAHVAAIESSHNVFAYFTAAGMGVARVGGVAVAHALWPVSAANLPVYLAVVGLCAGAGGLALMFLSRHAGAVERALHDRRALAALGAYIVILAAAFDGAGGVLVLTASAGVGYLCLRKGVSRTMCMASIIVPALLFRLG